MATDITSLVDAERGLVSRRIFIEPEIYEQELAQIFARCWLFLCHESQLPHPSAIPLPREVLAYHRERVARRAEQEGRPPSYHMTIADIYALSKGLTLGTGAHVG